MLYLQAASNIEDFASAKAAGYKVFQIIDREPPIDSLSEEGHKPDRIVGEVEFKKVDFTYPSRPDVQVRVISCWQNHSDLMCYLVLYL